MKNPFGFFLELVRQPVWIPLWVSFLMLVNMASVAFWSEPLAKVIFITFMVSATLMMGLYACLGFTKILGLGHILWIPLLIYVLIRIPHANFGFRSYLVVFSISVAASLAFDIADVYQFFKHRKGV